MFRLFKREPHCYTVYNLKKKEYFTKDYNTREEAYMAMIRYLTRHDLTLEDKEESTHCKEYSCSGGYKFYINREY